MKLLIAGEMVNLVSHDALSVAGVMPYVNFMIFAPFEVTSMYIELLIERVMRSRCHTVVS